MKVTYHFDFISKFPLLSPENDFLHSYDFYVHKFIIHKEENKNC